MTKYRYDLQINSDSESVNKSLKGEYDSLDELKKSLLEQISLIEEDLIIPSFNLTHFDPLFDDANSSTDANKEEVDVSEVETFEADTEPADEFQETVVAEASEDDDFEEDNDKSFDFDEKNEDQSDENVTDDFDGMV